MSWTTADYVQALERRVSILKRMDESLRECQAATAAMDYERIVRCNELQFGICHELKVCDENIVAVESALGAGWPIKLQWNRPQSFRGRFDSVTTVRLGELIAELGKLQHHVHYLNHVCGNILLSTRRTMGILENLIVLYSGTPYRSGFNTEMVPSNSYLQPR